MIQDAAAQEQEAMRTAERLYTIIHIQHGKTAVVGIHPIVHLTAMAVGIVQKQLVHTVIQAIIMTIVVINSSPSLN